MRVLLLGSGGREHALFWKLSQSPKLKELYVFPGNGGFPEASIIRKEGLSLSNINGLADYIISEKYDLVVVGPEQPLVDGISDALKGRVPVFGPDQYAAQLEGSKDFSKSFMNQYNIPTAGAKTFDRYEEAFAYLKTRSIPVVIKADGLAAGKGVTVALTFEEADQALKDNLINKKFKDSSSRVLIEDFMTGEEASVFAICDGERALPFIAAQDYKRVFDENRGPNTGGMGAYAPVPFMTPSMIDKVHKQILTPVIEGMKKEGHPYKGLLYAGLMVHNENIRVVEFNVRFGDPETQVLMRLLDEDLLELCYLAATGNLPERKLRFKDECGMIVVMAADGYPDDYKKNIELKSIENDDRVAVFHAGTTLKEGKLLSNGGRVLGVTATGKSMQDARKFAYQAVDKLKTNGLFNRSDIGKFA